MAKKHKDGSITLTQKELLDMMTEMTKRYILPEVEKQSAERAFNLVHDQVRNYATSVAEERARVVARHETAFLIGRKIKVVLEDLDA